MSGAEDVAVLQDVAFAIIQADGTIRSVRGCTVERQGPGDYDVTLDPSGVGGPNVDQAEIVASVGLISAFSRKASVNNTSGNVKAILITDFAGVAGDTEFSLTLSRLL